MKKFYRLISLLMLLLLCYLSSCSRDWKATSKDMAETDTNTDTLITSLFDDYTNTLDGANAEKYAADLYAAYQSTDPLNFIRLLSQQEINRIKPIVNLLVSEVMNSSDSSAIKEFIADIEELLDTKDLTELEEYLVYEIYTNILYYRIIL
jgi:hypothetical protein